MKRSIKQQHQFQLKQLYCKQKLNIQTEVDDTRNSKLISLNYSPLNKVEHSVFSNRWKINKGLLSNKANRLMTQQQSDSETEFPNQPKIIQLSQRSQVQNKRSISNKRNNSIGDYNQSPKNQNRSSLFTSQKQRSYSIQQQQQQQRQQQQSLFQSVGIKQNQANDPKTFIQQFELTIEEWDKFGNRFPFGFQREKLLGRGGFSLIWLAKEQKGGALCAVKQIPRKSKHETHFKELAFITQFFNKGGQIKSQYQQNEGIKNLCKMLDYVIDPHDVFIMYEVCGYSLGTQLYDFESLNNSYKLIPQKLSLLFKQFPVFLLKFIKRITSTIDLLVKTGWVHSDIKSENILISYGQQDVEYKIIDYGSSFKFVEVFEKFSMATPEYMSPEMLTFILRENQMSYDNQLIESLVNYDKSWVIDIWGLGCVVLEIISGLPLWMSYDTQVINYKGQKVMAQGLFAVTGRSFSKIVEKQIKILTNLEFVLREQNYSGIQVSPLLTQLLKGMLAINPKQRYSPQQILNLLQDI
ncbi:unnamed protein product [Paramecium octaurelia]|uniref:Protein kinase domain-containing protein n=1 Tax=Paramecium octaurelia TaxID=43137 RepID=A0A8S1T8H0_PAROT|nr:unnamed protein product [Paramecium octaurelia]